MELEKRLSAFKTRYFNEIADLVKHVIANIDDDCEAEGIDEPSIQLTIACNSDLTGWAYQTGNNSYVGSCYHYQHWATTSLCRDNSPSEMADYLIEELLDAVATT